jgi:hypothetical protein
MCSCWPVPEPILRSQYLGASMYNTAVVLGN